MTGMIIRIIQKGGRIMTGEMIIKVQHKKMTNCMIIEKVENKIFQHDRITIVNSKKEVVIRINRIDPRTKNFISQKHYDNFKMILRETIRITMRMDVPNMNRGKAVDHSFLAAICAGKMDIMLINVCLKQKEKHLALIW